MSSNYPENNESSSSTSNKETSFTQNISARMKKFFKITNWFTSSTTSNSNGIERSIEEDVPEGPPSKKMRFNHPGTSASYTSSIDTRNASTNTDSSDIYGTVQAGIVGTPTPSTYSDDKEENLNYNHNFSLSNNSKSILRKRKSIFDSHSIHSEAHGSTFYQGETVYGGASTSYMNRPNIKCTKNTHLNEHKINHDVTISHSAGRICDLLENYHSPLIEAKRILQCTNNKNSEDTISVKNSTVTNSFADKNQQLHTPCLANILKFKQKTRLMDTTRAARQLVASQSSSVLNILPNNESSTNQEKKSEGVFTKNIQTKLTTPDYGILVRETQPTLILPSNALQIDMNNLPTFSQFLPKASHNESENKKIFKFSSPEKKAKDFTKIQITPPKWSGSLDNNEILRKKTNMPSAAKSIMFTNHGNNKKNSSDVSNSIPIVIPLNEWVCPTCLLSNDNSIESCLGCDEKKPKETESSNMNVVSDSITTPINLNKWRCPTCLLNNDNSIASCAGCDVKKPKKTKPSNTAVVSDSNTKSINLNKWRCPTCLLNNDNSIASCGGCDVKKPKKTKSSNTAVVSDSITKSINVNTWRCSTCLLNNDNSIESCGGCGEKIPKNTESSNVPVVSDFMIKPIDLDKWRCPTCMIKNDNSIESCVCCREKKPKKTEFSNTAAVSDSITKPIDLDKWRCPTCMINNDNSIESCGCGEKKPKKTESSNTAIVLDSITIPIDLDKWRCPTCMIKNDNSIESCVCCGEKKPKKTESSNTAAVSDSITKPIDLDKWRCPSCMIKNDNSIELCVCCGEKKPKKTESSNTTFVSDSITKPIDLDKWRCPTCMIKNDNSIESCVCCGEKKPKKTESSNTAVVSDSIIKPNISFSNHNMSITASTLSTTFVDSQKDKWECPGCYVRNEKNVNRCACCETNKPGLFGITQNKGFNFSKTNENAFKFGIIPKDYTKPEKPSMEVSMCYQDNNLSKTNEADTHNKFTFGATTAAAEPAVVPASVALVTSAPVPSAAPEVFAASVASAAPVTTAAPVAAAAPITTVAPLPFAASVFPTPSIPTGTDETIDIDNNGKQKSVLPETTATGPTNILVSPLSPIQRSMSVTFMNNTDSSINEPQIACTSIQAQNQFSFSTAPPQGIQPVVKLFSPPTTSSSPFLNTQVSASSLDTPVSNVSEVSYASNPVTTSFFQCYNLISNPAPSTSSFFKRTETKTIGASNPSIFSFGNSTQNLQPQPESSKFNFSFTKNNPGGPSIFSAQPFGSQTCNAIEGNKLFNLTAPSGNSNTGIINNTLPGNGLSTGNPMESSSRGNGVVILGDGITSNQIISGNNLLSGQSSHSTVPGFHTQMNRDVWPTSNTGANSFFTGNTKFNSPNSIPPTPAFDSPSGSPATRFSMATEMSINLPTQNIFGSQPPANVGGIFSASHSSMVTATGPSFERTFGNPANPPPFNFGAGAQTNSGIFGQTQIQANHPTVYNFGGQPNGLPQVQFNMGSSPGTPARRVRKAIRRTTQR